jgi:hypothetical protein
MAETASSGWSMAASIVLKGISVNPGGKADLGFLKIQSFEEVVPAVAFRCCDHE